MLFNKFIGIEIIEALITGDLVVYMPIFELFRFLSISMVDLINVDTKQTGVDESKMPLSIILISLYQLLFHLMFLFRKFHLIGRLTILLGIGVTTEGFGIGPAVLGSLGLSNSWSIEV